MNAQKVILSFSSFASLIASMLIATASSTEGAVLRTLCYHQITQFTNTGIHTYGRTLVLSADGRKMVFARPQLSNPATNLIYTANFDGSGLTLVDAWEGSGYAQVDISADGSRVLSTDRGIVRLVNADGSNARQVIQVHGGFPDFRITPDGSQVIFSQDRYFGTTPDTGNREPGLYVINADGTGFHEISSLTGFSHFLGIPPEQIAPQGFLPGWNGGNPFGLSGDGSRLVCCLWTPTNGYRLLGLSTSGTNLHELPLAPSPIWSFNRVGLSGDGQKVFYYFIYAPCCSSGEELGVINWDGSGRRVLLSNYSTNQSSGGYGVKEITMNQDGSKLLFGGTSWLFNTDGSGRLALGWTASFATSKLLQEGFSHGSLMDSGASRFVFLTTAGTGLLQVGTAELNPPRLGLAPAIAHATSSPPYLVKGEPSPIFSFQPVPTNGLVLGGGAQAGILLHDMADPGIWQGSTLNDEGVNGDAAKDDSIYSDKGGYFFGSPSIGPRTVRFKAEALGADGVYHSTAVDVAPFFVLAASPTNLPPAILSVSPPNGTTGVPITLTGRGFDPVATNNVVLFGNVPAQVMSVNPAGTELVVTISTGFSETVPVTVSSQGQTSSPFYPVGPGPETVSLAVKMLAGVQISGPIGDQYRIDYLSNLANTNSWAPLTNLVLLSSPYFWVDLSSTNQPRRFYRAVRIP